MWIEEFSIENVRCFERQSFRFGAKAAPYRWVTLLSENGGGKSTVLQSLALLLAGPEGAQKLLPRPLGWLRDESRSGKLSLRIHQGDNDPGRHGESKIKRAFGYSFHVTGSQQISIRGKTFTEAGVHESRDRTLTWLRQNAFPSKGKGWFAVGYGAFRRLTRSSQIIVPSLEPQARFSNFSSQFIEDEPLSAFERWMVYLDYRVEKSNDAKARRLRELGINAINELLPQGVRYDSVADDTRILFDVGGKKVPTIALSDGYRSVLALGGDLVWRLIQSFPDSDAPLREEGVVLVDELDIHLHPVWQRDIAAWLQQQFPNLQFIVATHSPLVAGGAGKEAKTLRLSLREGVTQVEPIEDIWALSVDRILQSPAFGLVSPFSPQVQRKIDRYDELLGKERRAKAEENELRQLSLFMESARPFRQSPQSDTIDRKLTSFLATRLK